MANKDFRVFATDAGTVNVVAEMYNTFSIKLPGVICLDGWIYYSVSEALFMLEGNW